tara:strand:+ start:67 stop:807 length:741 start_codon:yes stop_codon:yes gene_type:complete
MDIYPAIDLKNGQGVRLLHGNFEKMTIYAPDVAAQADEFISAGCSWIHVVDLDGALEGRPVNIIAVEQILKAGSKVQLGGGIRDLKTIEDWLSLGVDRLILGTAALKNPALIKEAAKMFEGRIAVGADAKGGMIAAEGWLEVSSVPVIELARRFEDCGVSAIIFTDISRDGALTGVNADATAKLAQAINIPVIASGGVRGIEDIRACAELARFGIDGVITGRALYDGRLSLRDAVETAARLAQKDG